MCRRCSVARRSGTDCSSTAALISSCNSRAFIHEHGRIGVAMLMRFRGVESEAFGFEADAEEEEQEEAEEGGMETAGRRCPRKGALAPAALALAPAPEGLVASGDKE